VDDICKSLQENQQTDVLILDFAKAFDKVNHAQTAAFYKGGISCTIHLPIVPAYLDLFVEFQHRCCWILSGTLLCHWSSANSLTVDVSLDWMKFHPDKCTVLRVTNKKKTFDAKYQLHGHTLESVTSTKYLGLTFTSFM
jgi:hypothetical protein